MPSGSSVSSVWGLIERVASAASGASRAKVVEFGPEEAAPPGVQRRTFPFRSSRWPNGRLELDVARQALFLDDDVELIELLVERGTRAAERESFLLERERLIGELQAAS